MPDPGGPCWKSSAEDDIRLDAWIVTPSHGPPCQQPLLQSEGETVAQVRNNRYANGLRLTRATVWTDPEEGEAVLEFQHPLTARWDRLIVINLEDVEVPYQEGYVTVPPRLTVKFKPTNWALSNRFDAFVFWKVACYEPSRYSRQTPLSNFERATSAWSGEVALMQGIRQRIN